MSLASENIVQIPTEDQLAQVRDYIKARMELRQVGLTQPKTVIEIKITSGSNDKETMYTLTEFVSLCQQLSEIYKGIFGKKLGE